MQSIKSRKVLSTIRVAKMLGVAVASVSKWIDEGQIIAGRTPGGHRRIQALNLLDFLHKHKLPIPAELQDSSQKALIVDDDKAHTSWLTKELRRRHPDLEILVAHDGFSAGELVATFKPEVVIIDVKTAGIDGLEVCRRIRGKVSEYNTSVIVVSSSLTSAIEKNLLNEGATACLVKPIDIDRLEVELLKVLSN